MNKAVQIEATTDKYALGQGRNTEQKQHREACVGCRYEYIGGADKQRDFWGSEDKKDRYLIVLVVML